MRRHSPSDFVKDQSNARTEQYKQRREGEKKQEATRYDEAIAEAYKSSASMGRVRKALVEMPGWLFALTFFVAISSVLTGMAAIAVALMR